ncbi:HAD superfamily (Subfamily IG) hydrolase, 5'-nucleotidase [Minicystis rosea]|nr:HAD superfamily (Subfamily IG) hydrolase, 5'-nucleotidase [Minicystis rosea]
MATVEELVSQPIPRERSVFCNRTLNLRSIRAIGYDMDYTLIHYATGEWERRAYEHLRTRLAALGWPVKDLDFDPSFAIRGLILDVEKGNIIKANRFGYVKRAFHGQTPLSYEEQRLIYGRTIVDLAEPRWVFLNTFFSLSEAHMYMQLVELLDRRLLPEVLGYADLYRRVKHALDLTHMEGALKAEIVADPERFIIVDPETPLALLDQRKAGKKLLLVSNSEWIYTRAVMAYAFDRFLPEGMTFRDVFDVIIVGARKPEFFTQRSPIFEVVSDDGLLRPAFGLRDGGAFLGGNAAQVEEYLGFSGDEFLYVGDHIYGDVKVSKSMLRWRTGLIVRELEGEIAIEDATRQKDERLAGLMRDKEQLEQTHCRVRLALQRVRDHYGPEPDASEADLVQKLADLRAQISTLDAEISPMAKAASELSNPRWGLLMRAGNDKSHLARQVERSADIYTSRVSNFLFCTPFAYFRPPRGTLPHDPSPAAPGSLPIESA